MTSPVFFLGTLPPTRTLYTWIWTRVLLRIAIMLLLMKHGISNLRAFLLHSCCMTLASRRKRWTSLSLTVHLLRCRCRSALHLGHHFTLKTSSWLNEMSLRVHACFRSLSVKQPSRDLWRLLLHVYVPLLVLPVLSPWNLTLPRMIWLSYLCLRIPSLIPLKRYWTFGNDLSINIAPPASPWFLIMIACTLVA